MRERDDDHPDSPDPWVVPLPADWPTGWWRHFKWDPLTHRPRWLTVVRRVFRIQGRYDDLQRRLGDWKAPPLDAETEARLQAIGIKPATGRFDPSFHPLPQRPKRLAFLYRTFPFLDRDDDEDESGL